MPRKARTIEALISKCLDLAYRPVERSERRLEQDIDLVPIPFRLPIGISGCLSSHSISPLNLIQFYFNIAGEATGNLAVGNVNRL